MKIFGKINPDPKIDNPTQGISSSLHYYKKEISYFIPNNTTKWYVKNNTGNTTISELLTKLIADVEQKEVRG